MSRTDVNLGLNSWATSFVKQASAVKLTTNYVPGEKGDEALKEYVFAGGQSYKEEMQAGFSHHGETTFIALKDASTEEWLLESLWSREEMDKTTLGDYGKFVPSGQQLERRCL